MIAAVLVKTLVQMQSHLWKAVPCGVTLTQGKGEEGASGSQKKSKLCLLYMPIKI